MSVIKVIFYVFEEKYSRKEGTANRQNNEQLSQHLEINNYFSRIEWLLIDIIRKIIYFCFLIAI